MATYNSFKELNGKTLKPGDCVIFNIKNKKFKYEVFGSYLRYPESYYNAIIFSELNISDKNEYAKKLYNYPIRAGFNSTNWPEYETNDFEAATCLVLDLFNRCEAINSTNFKPSLYNVGDIVTVKDKYDDGYNERDYPYVFTKGMLKEYGGKNVTISSVNYAVEEQKKKGHVENYFYIIEGSTLSWCASMFKEKVEKTKKFEDAGFSFTVEDIPKDCPYHPYVIDQAIVEFTKEIDSKITSAKQAFDVCTSIDIGAWFHWSKTSQGLEYWSNIATNKSFIPTVYIPTYFIETPNKTTPEITSVPKSISKTPLKISCNYEETTLSIEKKKVYF